MAIKRADVRNIFSGIEGVEDSHISKLMSLIHTEVDGIKDERDELRTQLDEATKNGGKDADTWKTKYEAEHSAFESYKEEQTKKETEASKRTALQELLKDVGLSENGQAKALKYTALDDIELDEKGGIKGAKKLMDSIKEEWSDYVTDTDNSGQRTPSTGAPASGGKTNKTKEEIMNMTDAVERQQAMAENHELFGF